MNCLLCSCYKVDEGAIKFLKDVGLMKVDISHQSPAPLPPSALTN